MSVGRVLIQRNGDGITFSDFDKLEITSDGVLRVFLADKVFDSHAKDALDEENNLVVYLARQKNQEVV